MAKITPDPKKRGYLLPSGCKDLIDALQPRARRKIGAALAAPQGPLKNLYANAAKGLTGTFRELVTGQLSDLERYVTRLSESRARWCMLSISSADPRLTVAIYRLRGYPMRSIVTVQMVTEPASAARIFLASHGFKKPGKSKIPASLNPNLPVYESFDMSPLPLDRPLVSSLMLALFHEVAGLNDHSEMYFHYNEVTDD